MATIVTLSSSEMDEDGFIFQTITDGSTEGHRHWKPGTSGPEAAWTKGCPDDIPTHSVVSTALTALEERTWRNPIHASAYSVRRRLEQMRVNVENNDTATSTPGTTSTGGIDFASLVPPVRRVEDVTLHGAPWMDVFDYALAKQVTVLFEGETGEGKTFLGEQWSARKGWPVIKVSGNAGASPEKFLGYDIIKDGNVVPQLGLIPQALLRGECTIILDELGFFPPEMLTPLYPVLDNSKMLTLEFGGGISIPVPDTVLIIATNNPGYEGVFAENHALRRRFQVRVNHSLPDSVVRALIPQVGVREMAVKLREAFRNEQVTQWLPLPTVQEFTAFAEQFGVDFAVENLITLYVDEGDRSVVRQTVETFKGNLENDFKPKPKRHTPKSASDPEVKLDAEAEADAIVTDDPFAGL